MAFVNEYIPKEDIEKHQIEETNPQWTIDRERQVFLRMHYFNRQRDGEGAWWEAELNIEGKTFICKLEYGAGHSIKFNERPYVIVWNLININPKIVQHITRERVQEILKEALTVYGYAGARKQIPTTCIKCNF